MRYQQHETTPDNSSKLPDQPRTHPANMTTTRSCRQTAASSTLARRAIREALEPYVDLRKLRRLAAHGGNLQEALTTGAVPEDVQAIITFVAELLRPVAREQVKRPADAAAFLMARMGLLDQEELWVMLLNTKNHVIAFHRVYQGSLNSSMVRIGEVFREALRLNAASILVCHNHPSGAVDASPEDVLVTRQIIEAGKILDIPVIDHIILGKGQWMSMRERGLGF